MYPFINKILVILSYTVNNFGPLIKDDETEEFEQFLNDLPEEGEDTTDPNVDEFIQNDRFVRDFDDDDSNMQ